MIQLPNEQEIMQKTAPELTLLLYLGLTDQLTQARGAIDQKDYLSANHHLQRSNDILRRLGAGLNYEADRSGGIPLADRLESIYQYMAAQLVRANLEKNRTLITEVMTLLQMITDAWQQAMRKGKDDRHATHARKLSAYDSLYD